MVTPHNRAALDYLRQRRKVPARLYSGNHKYHLHYRDKSLESIGRSNRATQSPSGKSVLHPCKCLQSKTKPRSQTVEVCHNRRQPCGTQHDAGRTGAGIETQLRHDTKTNPPRANDSHWWAFFILYIKNIDIYLFDSI